MTQGNDEEAPPVSPGLQRVGRMRVVSEELHAEFLGMRELMRKRPPSEKPNDDEVVLVATEHGLSLASYRSGDDKWIAIGTVFNIQRDRIAGWWPIEHLLDQDKGQS